MNILPLHDLHMSDIVSWPRTRFGIIAAWLGILGLGIAVAHLLTEDGSHVGLLQLEAILMIIVSPAALIAAVIAAFRDHERSLFVWIPVVLGSLFLVLMLVELTFPAQ
jgi:predicted membrane-bound spermidine synthase